MSDFSPTFLVDWMRCPRYALFHKAAWTPRLLGKKDFAALVGEGVHAGLAVLYGEEWDKDRATGQTKRVMTERWTRWQTEKRTWPESPKDLTRSLEEWQGIAGHMVRHYASVPTYPSHASQSWSHVPLGETFAVELTLGHGRIDWLGKVEGEWAVVDFKTKLALADRYRADLADLFDAWALYDYCARASAHLGTPVRLALTQTVVYEPATIIEATLRISESQMAAWEQDAQWYRLAITNHANSLVPRNWTRCKNFGFNAPCDFLTACWQDGGTPNELEYVKETR